MDLRRTRRAAVLLATTTAVFACSADDGGPAAETTTPSTSGAASGPLLVYQAPGVAGDHITVTAVDGSDVRAPAEELGGAQSNPDWSPDGQRLVFVLADDDGTDDLWTVGLGDEPANLLLDCSAPCTNLDDPAWSPDGRTVLYGRLATGVSGSVATLEQVDVDTSDVEVLLSADAGRLYAGPRWSPDGTSVVLEVVELASVAPDSEVVGVTLSIVDLTANPPSIAPLTDPLLFAATADWSPDGELIVYSGLPTPDSEAPDLFTIRPDGSGAARLTSLGDEGGAAEHPAFSPDGAAITFLRSLDDGSRPGLASIDVAGGDAVPAVGTTFRAGAHPRWQPVA